MLASRHADDPPFWSQAHHRSTGNTQCESANAAVRHGQLPHGRRNIVVSDPFTVAMLMDGESSHGAPATGGLAAGWLTIAATVLTGGLLVGCEDATGPANREGRAQPPVKIVTETVQYRADTRRVEAIGTARARRSAVIYPKAGGAVTAVHFSAGGRVDADALLLELDPRGEELALQRTRVAVQDARQLLTRYEQIDEPGAISASQVEAARIALRAAALERDTAQLALTERSVRAPFAGHVGLSDVDAGTRITNQTAITRLDDRSELYVDFSAPEEVFRRIRANDRIPVQPFAYPEQTLEARVVATDSHVDASSRSFIVRTVIDNSDDGLRPGMSFRVRFEVRGERFPAVPEAAIVWGGDGAYLWAVRDGRAARVALTIIAREEDRVLLRAPLAEGALIVAEGVQKMREGRAVTAINSPAPAVGAGATR